MTSFLARAGEAAAWDRRPAHDVLGKPFQHVASQAPRSAPPPQGGRSAVGFFNGHASGQEVIQ